MVMNLILSNASLNSISFKPGSEIELSLEFSGEVGPINKVSNISVDISRIDQERNQFAFGFGTAPTEIHNSVIKVAQKLPPNIRAGLHYINSTILSYENGTEVPDNQIIEFKTIFFVIQLESDLKSVTDHDLKTLISDMDKKRTEYVNHPFVTERSASTKSKSFRMFVFGAGTLIHSHQQLMGYSIRNTGIGLSHRRMHEIVNHSIAKEAKLNLQFDDQVEASFQHSTPTFMISYNNVIAVNQDDAIAFCREHSSLIFQILGFELGQMPQEFAVIAIEYQTFNCWSSYQMPGFRGNLVSQFNPSSTANSIDHALPKLQANPFLRLIYKAYADATRESEYGFSLLRFWSVMELVADRDVAKGQNLKHPDGSLILKFKGKPETTDTKHGRVYQYILSSGAYTSSGTYFKNGKQLSYCLGHLKSDTAYDASAEYFSVWDIVKAVYEIRNAVAHEGHFDLKKASKGNTHQKLAARLKLTGPINPLEYIRARAQMAIWEELKSSNQQ